MSVRKLPRDAEITKWKKPPVAENLLDKVKESIGEYTGASVMVNAVDLRTVPAEDRDTYRRLRENLADLLDLFNEIERNAGELYTNSIDRI